MRNSSVNVLCVLVCVTALAGCRGLSGQVESPGGQQVYPSGFPQAIEDLAGTWEYVDTNGSFPIMLDEEGKGTYDWKDGRFETVELQNGVWKGRWYQTENDREGKFTIILSPHSSVAQGTWWYTRIGSDTNPLEPGGEFIMKHRPGMMTSGNSRAK